MQERTDNDLRGIVLKKFYDVRREGRRGLTPSDFLLDISQDDISRISWQLYESQLIAGTFHLAGREQPRQLYTAEITAAGVDVVEGTAVAPISISISEDNRVINISDSTGVQIGDYNFQQIVATFESIVDSIDASDASPEETSSAKKRLSAFLKHPLVAKALGKALDNSDKLRDILEKF